VQPILKLSNVTKRIGGKTIINQLSFEVPRGEVFGFLGPNGSGKTTTIRMIVGLMELTDGQIEVNGINVTKQFEQAMTYVGGIVENPEMYKYMSGYDNLVHYARMHKGITRQRIDEMVELVGLKSRIRDKVKTYSLGMRQRLGVAQALLHKPQLLILDEPTNGLDPAGIRELRDYLRKLAHEQGITVFVSSHLLSEMELMCDRVAIIQEGKLIDIRQLHVETNEQQVLMAFEVDEVVRAIEVVKGIIPADQVEIVDNNLQLNVSRDQVPSMNRALVEANIAVYSIQSKQTSLEDQFLAITAGGSDHA
jgi:ABC-2 type transport system ATP-binding protein